MTTIVIGIKVRVVSLVDVMKMHMNSGVIADMNILRKHVCKLVTHGNLLTILVGSV